MIVRSSDDSFANVDTLGGALQRSIKEISSEIGGGDVPLKEHPGKGLTTLQMGMDTLMRRARTMDLRDDVAEAAKKLAYDQYFKGQALCESPIERSMLAALLTAPWNGFEAVPPLVHSARDKDEMLPPGDIVIVPQMAFLRFRLDFGLVLRIPGFTAQIVAVECDGADFHNDFRREIDRVKYLKSWNIPVFKLTGKEIHTDALEAANKVAFGVCQWRALL